MIIPRVGDIWETKLPGKSKKRNEIGSIGLINMHKKDGTQVCRPYANCERLPRGRYSGIRVKWLLKHGTRIGTKEMLLKGKIYV